MPLVRAPHLFHINLNFKIDVIDFLCGFADGNETRPTRRSNEALFFFLGGLSLLLVSVILLMICWKSKGMNKLGKMLYPHGSAGGNFLLAITILIYDTVVCVDQDWISENNHGCKRQGVINLVATFESLATSTTRS